jgi:hypothetical protein
MYRGDVRRAAATGRPDRHLVTKGTRLQKVGTHHADGGSKLEILPGLSAVSVSLNDKPAPGTNGPRDSEDVLAACLDARAGHAYRVSPVYQGDAWWPAVVDLATAETLPVRILKAERPNCYAPTPPAPAPRTNAVAAAPAPGDSESDGGGATQEGAPAAPSPAHPVGLVHLRQTATAARRDRPERSRGSFRVESSLASGGDSVPFNDGVMRNLSAGSGEGFSLGVSWTPVWIRGQLGLGADLDGGFKSANGDGGVWLLRAPVATTVHALFAVGNHWSILARGGAERDLDLTLLGNQSLDFPLTKLSSRWGEMIEAGPYYTNTRALGWTLAVRFTNIRYEDGPRTISAASLGLAFSIHLDFVGAGEAPPADGL